MSAKTGTRGNGQADRPRDTVHRAPSRFVLFRDKDGRKQAVARQSVSALCEDDDGTTMLLLPGGRFIIVNEPLEAVMAMLGSDRA